MAQGRVDQAAYDLALRNHDERLRDLEQSVGIWHYVTPVAPATAPSWAASDPLSVPFQNGCANIDNQQAVSFRQWPATKIQLRGSINPPSLPVLAFTLPEGFRPAEPTPILFPATDGSSAYTGRIDTNGDVWVLTNVTGSSLVLQDGEETVGADNPSTITADGSQHFDNGVLMASPPAWLDTSSEITVPGLYMLGVNVKTNTAFTTPGGTANWIDAFAGGACFPLDGLALAGFGGIFLTDFITLTADDLPWYTGGIWKLTSDATGVIDVWYYASQMASVA